MKRIGNLYTQICSQDNIILADQRARKRKANQSAVKLFDVNREANLGIIIQSLSEQTYQVSAYETFKIFEGKERLIFKLPYTDRVVQHAIINVLEPIFRNYFIAHTYSCIKGRGIHRAKMDVEKALKQGVMYCLKLDVVKFYPSVDHEILKQLLRTKFKDQKLLGLLDTIIESAPGLPIGNYLSQPLANFYLTPFDRWIKAKKFPYFRYADDMVILSSSKAELQTLLHEIIVYLKDNLKLDVKGNYQVFPVPARGIDFVGYRIFHTHVKLRKSIKLSYIKTMLNNPSDASKAAYNGWLKHCDSKTLKNKYDTIDIYINYPAGSRGTNLSNL